MFLLVVFFWAGFWAWQALMLSDDTASDYLREDRQIELARKQQELASAETAKKQMQNAVDPRARNMIVWGAGKKTKLVAFLFAW